MRPREWLLLVVLSVLWGGTFFFVAVALNELPPLTLVLVRVGVAALVLVPLVLLLRHRLPVSLRALHPFLMLALLNNVVPFTLIAYAQTRVASALAAVLNATTPLFTLVLARVFAADPLGANRVIGIVLGIAGVAVLGADSGAGGNATLLGMFAILVAALSYGLAALWMRRLRDTPPLVAAAVQLACSTVMLLPIALIIDRPWQLSPPTLNAIWSVLALAVFSTALAYIAFFRISAAAGPSNVMLVTLLIPVTATVLGVLVLGETLSLDQIAGALIIASGLLVIDGRVLRWLRRRLRPA